MIMFRCCCGYKLSCLLGNPSPDDGKPSNVLSPTTNHCNGVDCGETSPSGSNQTAEQIKTNHLEMPSATVAKSRLFPTASSSSCPHLTSDEEEQRLNRVQRHNASTRNQESIELGGTLNNSAFAAQMTSAGSETPSRRFFDPSRVTKTYSFKRMMSFRASKRSNGTSIASQDGSQGNHHYLPLQLSFLGQIYRKTAVRRTSSSNTSVTNRPKFTIEPPSSPLKSQDE